jgi:hypothetical protein
VGTSNLIGPREVREGISRLNQPRLASSARMQPRANHEGTKGMGEEASLAGIVIVGMLAMAAGVRRAIAASAPSRSNKADLGGRLVHVYVKKIRGIAIRTQQRTEL